MSADNHSTNNSPIKTQKQTNANNTLNLQNASVAIFPQCIAIFEEQEQEVQ